MHRLRLTETGAQVALTIGVGVAVGVATLLGQSVLPGDWNRLANSGAIWLLASFLVGSRMPTNGRAAVAGMATLVLAVVVVLRRGQAGGAGVSTRTVVIWVGTALVGGPVYGAAGHWWRTGPPTRRVVAIGLMGGIVTAEGVSTLLRIPTSPPSAGWRRSPAWSWSSCSVVRCANDCLGSPSCRSSSWPASWPTRSSTASSPPAEPGLSDGAWRFAALPTPPRGRSRGRTRIRRTCGRASGTRGRCRG